MIEVKRYEHEYIIQELSTGSWVTKPAGVRVIHLNSKLYAECDIYQSAHKNKQAAIEAIETKLKEIL